MPDHMSPIRLLASDMGEQIADHQLAYGPTVHAQGCELWRDQAGERDVIATDDGDIIGNPSSKRVAGLNCANGCQVIVADQRFKVGATRQQPLRRFEASANVRCLNALNRRVAIGR